MRQCLNIHILQEESTNQTHQDEVYITNHHDNYFSGKCIYCFYQVSTIGQVEKDDIPIMQKQRCLKFAVAQGWNIMHELRVEALDW